MDRRGEWWERCKIRPIQIVLVVTFILVLNRKSYVLINEIKSLWIIFLIKVLSLYLLSFSYFLFLCVHRSFFIFFYIFFVSFLLYNPSFYSSLQSSRALITLSLSLFIIKYILFTPFSFPVSPITRKCVSLFITLLPLILSFFSLFSFLFIVVHHYNSEMFGMITH